MHYIVDAGRAGDKRGTQRTTAGPIVAQTAEEVTVRFSGKGDSGYTGLIGGERVPKYGLRPEAYGSIDEATSALGLARAQSAVPRTRELLEQVQEDLYLLMAELATPPDGRRQFDYQLSFEKVKQLECWIDELQEEVHLEHRFVLPGTTVASAAIDLGRAIVRRAERPVARLVHEGDVENTAVLSYLNRLSSFLFVLARYQEAKEDASPKLAQRSGRARARGTGLRKAAATEKAPDES